MIDDEKKVRIKKMFDAFLSLADDRKAINEQIKDEIKEAADLLQIKPKYIRKIFTAWKQRVDSGKDEFEELATLIAELET